MSFKTYLEKSMSKTSKDGLVSILIYFTKERLRNKYIDIYIYIYIPQIQYSGIWSPHHVLE